MPRPGPVVSAKKLEENRLAGIEVDKSGRAKPHPHKNCLEEEEQTWSDPEDRSIQHMVWRPIPPEERRCRRIIKSKQSPWYGNRCTSWAIRGGPVCLHHGGRLATVKKAAARRLAMAAPLAADRLIYIGVFKPGVSDADRIKALLAILDRAGVEGKQTITVEVAPWQAALRQLFAVGGSDADGNVIDGEVGSIADEDSDEEALSWSPEGGMPDEGEEGDD